MEIVTLADVSGNRLPVDYFDFLRFSNGGEGPLSVQPMWLILDDVDTVAQALRDKAFEEFFPGLIVIGSNGSGEGIAFDFRENAVSKIVYFDLVDIDLDESIQPLAPSFHDLLGLIEPEPTEE